MCLKKLFTFTLASILLLCASVADARSDKFRIIGGDLAGLHELKYVVGLYRSVNPICTGGIIGEKHILTAAHCVVNLTRNAFKDGPWVVAGGTNDLVKFTDGVAGRAVNIYVPIVFKNTFWNPQHGLGDIAIVELDKPLNLTTNKNLERLNLPNVKENASSVSYEGTIAKIAGYGWDKINVTAGKPLKIVGSKDGKLRNATAVMKPKSTCFFPFQPKKNDYLCAKIITFSDNTPQGLCSGDSGAPLVIDENVVIGVASATGSICNENTTGPSIYTNVASHLDFINNVLNGQTENVYMEKV